MDLKSVPILPSLITLGNLFFGFLAMAKVADAVWLGPDTTAPVISMFETAVLLILIAMVLDAIDGRVARMTGQTTAFGAQLDSLADVVTFVVAPAFVAKVLINFHDGPPVPLLPPHNKIYYFCSAMYVLGAAMRLARYNVESDGPGAEETTEFKGLPSPGAAAVICSLVAYACTRGDRENVLSQLLHPLDLHDKVIQAMPAMLVLIGLLMISKLPYPHMVYTLVKRRHSFPFLATLVVLIGLAAIEWQLALLVFAVSYAASGLVIGAYRGMRRTRGGPPPTNAGHGTAARGISTARPN